MKSLKVLTTICAISWLFDSQSNGLESSVRILFLIGVFIAIGSSRPRIGGVGATGLFLLLNSIWVAQLWRSGASLSSGLTDLAIMMCAFLIAASVTTEDVTKIWQSKFLAKIVVVSIAGVAVFSFLIDQSARGELPPTVILALASILLIQRRWLGGIAAFTLYAALTLDSGFRSPVLLVIVVATLLVVRFARSANGAQLAVSLLILPVLLFSAVQVGQESLLSESIDSRALQLGGSASAQVGEEARALELQSAGREITEFNTLEILVGRGHGAKTLGDDFDRRTAHNVWVNMVVRYGLSGVALTVVILSLIHI